MFYLNVTCCSVCSALLDDFLPNTILKHTAIELIYLNFKTVKWHHVWPKSTIMHVKYSYDYRPVKRKWILERVGFCYKDFLPLTVGQWWKKKSWQALKYPNLSCINLFLVCSIQHVYGAQHPPFDPLLHAK